MCDKYDGHSVPCEDGSWHWLGPWPSGAEMLTGRDNAVIFDPAQVFKLIQISGPDRALIADAPKLLAERDAALTALRRLVHHAERRLEACDSEEEEALDHKLCVAIALANKVLKGERPSEEVSTS